MKKLSLFGFIFLSGMALFAQNVAVTDDDAYSANTSAMLDVKSTTKGFLAPRVTTTQRNAIASPAAGLLVYDTTIGGYYYYNGSAWLNLTTGGSTGAFWSYSSPNIYMTTVTDKLGLGTSSPLHKIHLYESVAVTDGTDGNFIDIQNSYTITGAMSGIRFQNGTSANTFKAGIFYQDGLSWGRGNLILANNTTGTSGNATAADARLVLQNDGRVMVKGDPNNNVNTAIFAVQNADGDTVFAVYPEGVRIWVNDDGLSKATGSRGGFAVGGFSPSKAGFTNEYLRVTPDSVRVYIDETYVASKVTGSRGGFAVGGFSPSKGITDNYLFVQDDSTRVYVVGDEGFAVDNIDAGNEARYMDLTPENYFIGHQSGENITSGLYNSFLGYQAGMHNTSGLNNTFLGYQTGFSNTTGRSNIYIGNNAGNNLSNGMYNIYIGDSAGYNNTAFQVCNIFIGPMSGFNNAGSANTFVGSETGLLNTSGSYNTFMGNRAGWNNTIGDYNTFLGNGSGYNNSTGDQNVFIGFYSANDNTTGTYNTFIGNSSGYHSVGNGNVFIGYQAGYNETGSNKLYIDNSSTATPLIYGDFSTNEVEINNYLGVNTNPGTALHVERSINTTATPTNHVALIRNTSTGTSPDVLALQVGYTGSPSTGINFITFFKGGDVGIGAIEGNGTGGITLNTTSADYAEYLERLDVNEIFEPGDVVGVFGGKISKNTNNADLIMAISSGPIVLGNNPGEEKLPFYEKVGFMGQVPVKVIGKVNAGDFIISSGNNDGTAIAIPAENMHSEYFSGIIGIAWDSSDNSGIKLINTGIGVNAVNKFIQSQIERMDRIEKENELLKQHTGEIEKLKSQIIELRTLIDPSVKK